MTARDGDGNGDRGHRRLWATPAVGKEGRGLGAGDEDGWVPGRVRPWATATAGNVGRATPAGKRQRQWATPAKSDAGRGRGGPWILGFNPSGR